MRQHRLSTLMIGAFAVAIPLAVAAPASKLTTQESNQGQVTVAVTPLALSEAADAWRFEVRLNTHVTPLTQDLAAVSVLSDGKGHEETPVAWQGDPPGGHHRKGELVFKPISPAPESVTLTIRDVGAVPERKFVWTLPKS